MANSIAKVELYISLFSFFHVPQQVWVDDYLENTSKSTSFWPPGNYLSLSQPDHTRLEMHVF